MENKLGYVSINVIGKKKTILQHKLLETNEEKDNNYFKCYDEY